MLQKTRHRAVLLIALIVSLAGACLLTGCASVYVRFYEPAPNSPGSPVTPEASPLYTYSRNPDRDGKQLAREGYVLIGTSCFLGEADPRTPDRSYAGKQAMRQGMKLGTAVVMQHFNSATFGYWVFTSYWAYPVDKHGAAPIDFSFNWEGTIRDRCS